MNPEAEKIANLERPFSHLIHQPSDRSSWDINSDFQFVFLGRTSSKRISFLIISSPQVKIFRSKLLEEEDFSKNMFDDNLAEKSPEEKTVFHGHLTPKETTFYVNDYRLEAVWDPSDIKPNIEFRYSSPIKATLNPEPFPRRS